MPILERLPTPSATANSSFRLQADLGAFLNALNTLQAGSNNSPLASVFNIFGELNTRLDIDTQPLTGGLTSAVQAIQNALPANTLSYVESIEDAYSSVASSLSDSEIARQVSEGETLNEVAQAVIAEALSLFDARIADLADHLIDTERLQELRLALGAIQNFEQDFAAHQGNFLPFLANHLIGVAPDLLDAPLAHVNAVLHVLSPLTDTSLETTLNPARQSIFTAYRALLDAIQNLDPADAAGYAQITLHLDQLSTANDLLFTALNTLYSQLDGLIAAEAWDTIFSTYVDLLDAVDVGVVPTVDDVVRMLDAMVNDLLTRLMMVFDADDLRSRVEVFTRSIRDAVIGSPIGQIKETIKSFLERIGEGIETIPTEDVQRVVNEMLGKVRNVITQLNIGQLQQDITEAFASVNEFVNTNLNETLKNNVQTALGALANQLNNLPLANLLNDLNGALSQLQSLITELASALQSQIGALNELLQQAEALSYKPVSDAVIGEIDDLKSRLQAINPNALSDAEKLALKAALAILEAIDLESQESQVIAGLKTEYRSAENEVKAIFNQIVASLNQVRDKVGVFNPDVVLQPINGALDEANKLLDKANARTLLGSLYEQIDHLERMVLEIAPGRILDPLQPAYDELMNLLNRLDPTQWVAPLNALYAQIDRLISIIDITPVMDELDRKQRELLGKARNAILSAFDSLNLPPPLDGFLAQMRPVLELVTEAIFGDPDTKLKEIGLSIRERVDLSTIFAPLDDAFLRLVAMLETVPAGDLTSVMNTIRQSIGVGLDVLNPQTMITQLRAGQGRLQELAPTNLLAQTVNLVSVKAIFEGKVASAPPERNGDIVTVSARFDAVFSIVTPTVSSSQYAQLVMRHNQLLNTLRQRINQLDHSTASQHYANLRTNLERLLPDFLRQPTPLTHADIVAGLYRMRPSNKVAPVEELLSRFLRQLQPYESAIEPAINGFFDTLREIMMLINPLTLRDAVASIYETVRQKVRILDPVQLTDAINALLAPVKVGFQALNPLVIKEQLNASFDNVVHIVTVTLKQVLDDLVGIIDGQLRTLRAALRVVFDQLKAALATGMQSLKEILKQIEDLIFVEILERLGRVIDNLGVSFGQELDRVRSAFDEMIQAIPLGDGASESAGVSI
jgi:hypothetical protein